MNEFVQLLRSLGNRNWWWGKCWSHIWFGLVSIPNMEANIRLWIFKKVRLVIGFNGLGKWIKCGRTLWWSRVRIKYVLDRSRESIVVEGLGNSDIWTGLQANGPSGTSAQASARSKPFVALWKSPSNWSPSASSSSSELSRSSTATSSNFACSSRCRFFSCSSNTASIAFRLASSASCSPFWHAREASCCARRWVSTASCSACCRACSACCSVCLAWCSASNLSCSAFSWAIRSSAAFWRSTSSRFNLAIFCWRRR